MATNMRRELIQTADGSHSFSINEGSETYHSRHGAVQESMHVFIESGLRALCHLEEVRVFELGFGTGLNALLSWREAEATRRKVAYTSVEAFPLSVEEAALLNYATEHERISFLRMHEQSDGRAVISDFFVLNRLTGRFPTHPTETEAFDLIYYDAFGPNTQPDLWTADCLKRAYDLLAEGGALVTYCAKGQVRRDLQNAGFEVERLPGPPGKREMLRAWKRR